MLLTAHLFVTSSSSSFPSYSSFQLLLLLANALVLPKATTTAHRSTLRACDTYSVCVTVHLVASAGLAGTMVQAIERSRQLGAENELI